MSFYDVDDPVETVLCFCKDGEVMVVGEVSALDVELVDPVVMSDVPDPNLLNVGILQFIVPVVVVFSDFFDIEAPVTVDLRSYLDDLKAHDLVEKDIIVKITIASDLIVRITAAIK